MNYPRFDTAPYLWLPTYPPFQERREKEERISLLKDDVKNNKYWILTGSLVNWNVNIIHLFNLEVSFWLPNDIRIKRLTEREKHNLGKDEIQLDGRWSEHFMEFIEWASSHGTADEYIRSKKSHEKWMKSFNCPILKIEGDIDLEDRIKIVMTKIDELNRKAFY